ncbi:MAG TPA: hypothetical protein VGR34_06575 [Candidatus Dormibacteraeota bacterium]|nr:hypothetical protein [Candidatus Dormibacteraeota bacterium]
MTLKIAIALWTFLCAHQVIVTMLAGWIFSAYVTVIVTPPKPTSGRFYLLWYNLMHTAAANLDKLKGKNL